MKREELLHLADLSRINLTEEEIERFIAEFGIILDYVARVKDMAAETGAEPKVGILHNVFREDENPHEPGIYTDVLVSAAPAHERGYVKVKKILGQSL